MEGFDLFCRHPSDDFDSKRLEAMPFGPRKVTTKRPRPSPSPPMAARPQAMASLLANDLFYVMPFYVFVVV